MAKKNDAPTVVEVDVPVEKEATREEQKAKINALVDKYNESVEFAEFRNMRKIAADLSDEVAAYNAAAERECFDALKDCPDPLREAVMRQTFKGCKYGERKNKTSNQMEMQADFEAEIPIDPLRLYERVGKFSGKVGHDPQWPSQIEHLSAAFIVTLATEYGQKARTVWDTLAVGEFTRTLGPLNAAQTKTVLQAEVKKTIESMIGGDYKHIPKNSIVFLRDNHTKKGGRSETKAIKPRGATVRSLMMELCKNAIDGTEPTFTYDVAKK